MSPTSCHDCCGDACPICAKKCVDIFLPVFEVWTCAFLLERRPIESQEPGRQQKVSFFLLFERTLTGQIEYIKMNLYQIKHAHVEAMFLQLITVNFLKAEVTKDDVECLHWCVHRENGLEESSLFFYILSSCL
jgi:hypothetical protein